MVGGRAGAMCSFDQVRQNENFELLPLRRKVHFMFGSILVVVVLVWGLYGWFVFFFLVGGSVWRDL